MSSSLNPSSSYSKYNIRNRNPNPKACALLVIDVQNYFLSMVNPILSNLNTTIALCRGASIPVIFTRHRHKPLSHDGNHKGLSHNWFDGDHNNMLEEWWFGDLIIDRTVDAELMEGLDRKGGDSVVEKSTYSAFRKTGLEERLVEMGVKEVIVTGVMTNLCCETTAREAFVRGFWVFFSTDATATSNEDLHEATLKNMAYGFAYLVDCHRLKQVLEVDK